MPRHPIHAQNEDGSAALPWNEHTKAVAAATALQNAFTRRSEAERRRPRLQSQPRHPERGVAGGRERKDLQMPKPWPVPRVRYFEILSLHTHPHLHAQNDGGGAAVGGTRSIAPGFSRVNEVRIKSSPCSGRQSRDRAGLSPATRTGFTTASVTRLKPGARDLHAAYGSRTRRSEAERRRPRRLEWRRPAPPPFWCVNLRAGRRCA